MGGCVPSEPEKTTETAQIGSRPPDRDTPGTGLWDGSGLALIPRIGPRIGQL